MFQIFHKSRRYPIKYDEYGRSLRQQAFALFNQGYRPAQIFKQKLVPATLKTLFRYFEDWKKLPSSHTNMYRLLRRARKNTTGLSDEMIDRLSEYLGMSREEIIGCFQKPHGFKQFLLGKWPNYRRQAFLKEAEYRLRAALDLIDMADRWGIPPETFTDAIKTLLRRKRRSGRDSFLSNSS